MEAGGPLQASVRLLSGGDRDADGNSITQEAQPQNRAQQLQLGEKLMITIRPALPGACIIFVPEHCACAMHLWMPWPQQHQVKNLCYSGSTPMGLDFCSMWLECM